MEEKKVITYLCSKCKKEFSTISECEDHEFVCGFEFQRIFKLTDKISNITIEDTIITLDSTSGKNVLGIGFVKFDDYGCNKCSISSEKSFYGQQFDSAKNLFEFDYILPSIITDKYNVTLEVYQILPDCKSRNQIVSPFGND